MLKKVASIVLATVISTLLLSMLSFSPGFEFMKDDDPDETKATTVVTTTPATSANADQNTPGCDEDLSGSEENPAVTTVKEGPQIDYGWPEEPGPS